MPFHVRVSTNGQRDEVALDLTEEQLETRILGPYRQGLPLVISGRTIPVGEVKRIRINETDKSSPQLLAQVREEERGAAARSRVIIAGGPYYEWSAAAKGKEVTDDYIKTPPGSERSPANEPEQRGIRIDGLHPEVQAAAAGLCRDGHYSQAIFEAFKAIEIRVREQSGLTSSGRDLMAQAFGSDKPAIRLSDLPGQSGRDEQEGLRFLFMGAMQVFAIRRGTNRSNSLTPNDAWNTWHSLAFSYIA